MANILQSSENKSTCAPGYYNKALCTLSTCGIKDMNKAQYVGATDLQNKAFCEVANNQNQYTGDYTAGAADVGCAAKKDIAGATTNYLKNATNASPLCAANPYIQGAANMNLGQVAQCYMSPFLNNQVQNMSNVAQKNIAMNLAPQANAAAAGSGQFGSLRGAQVLGQTINNANQCLNAQLGNVENQAYTTAMGGAQAKLAGLNAAGQTAEQAQNAQNQANINAATEAANAASQCATAKTQAGQALGQLGTEGVNANIANENALATLGAQKQTILQNAQCYCTAKLAKFSDLMRGHTVPTNVSTTMCMSPVSAAAALAAATKASGLTCVISKGICKIGCWICGIIKPAEGGLIHANYGHATGGHIGCSSQRHLGGLPVRGE